MKQSQPSKSSFIVRNHSQNKPPSHRINSLQKQLNSFTQHQNENDYCEAREQSSAIMELLQIKDQTVQWKDKNPHKKSTKSKNTSRSPGQALQTDQPTQQIFNFQQEIQENLRQQQQLMQPSSFLGNIFGKRPSHQELNTKNFQMKKSKQFYDHENLKILRESSNNDNFLMNRTHYRNKQSSKISHQKNYNFSLTQRLNHRFLPKQTFYEKQLDQSLRVNSNFEFYRNKSPLEKKDYNEEENVKKVGEHGAMEKERQIKIVANKSITVRQMLSKINSHEDISIAEPTNEQKLRSLLEPHTNRQPFDPYSKKTPRQHYKKFTPFKVEEERKLEYSLQKLEEQIRRNPEIDNKWDEIEVRYLEKPTYCSWVQRNREKIKRKRNHPLTVRPLKLLN